MHVYIICTYAYECIYIHKYIHIYPYIRIRQKYVASCVTVEMTLSSVTVKITFYVRLC